ncbi:MAG: glycosyltransferase family 4 protein, partial [Oligoflexia bacterium]|nr:glycosyltransferase family 4 protein [Oligoflexia bacterium]
TTWFEVWGDYWRQYLGPAGRVGQRIERQAATGCGFHIAHSSLTAGRLRALCPDATVRMIPSGIDVSRPDPVPPRDPRRLAWCGRAIESKNLPLLLSALALWGDRDWSLDVVGDGPCLDAWKQAAARLGLGDRVHWHGFIQQRAELHRLLATAGILVQTSRREGMGKSALEAAALGCALVLLEHPEVATTGFLEDGRSALFFGGDSGSEKPQGLARLLAKLLGDSAEQRRLAQGGQAVAAELAWDRVVERVLVHYAQVAGA